MARAAAAPITTAAIAPPPSPFAVGDKFERKFVLHTQPCLRSQWHLSVGLQTTVVLTNPRRGSQYNVWQISGELTVILVCTHPVEEEQVSVVQALSSLQFTAVCWQPEAGLQESVVQSFMSLQLMGILEHAATPPLLWQESVVQSLLSLQLKALGTH